MKIFRDISILFFTLTLAIGLNTSFAFADSATNISSKELAEAFSVTKVVDDVAKKFSDIFSDGQVAATSSVATDTSLTATSTDATTSDDTVLQKDACDYFDDIQTNVVNLQTASSDTRKKISNVEGTINNETSLRDTILGSLKDFLGLQKKDKLVFKQMKKDISDAKIYYDNLDLQLDQTEKFLDENDCTTISAEDAQKVATNTQSLADDEAIFRKHFASDLKEKVKILQDTVKSAKK